MGHSLKNAGITAPEGQQIYEIFLRVRSRPGVLGAIATLLGSYNIDILGGHLQVHDRDIGINTFYVDASASRGPLEEVIERLRSIEGVIDVDYASMKEVFFEKYLFPLTSGGEVRIFVLSAESWMELEETLYRTFGGAAGALLHHSGKALGKSMIKKILERRAGKGSDNEILKANLEAMFKAYGLGLLKIKEENDWYEIEVEDPIMTVKEGRVIDHFTVGIIAGALEEIHKSTLKVEKISYDSSEKRLRILLKMDYQE